MWHGDPGSVGAPPQTPPCGTERLWVRWLCLVHVTTSPACGPRCRPHVLPSALHAHSLSKSTFPHFPPGPKPQSGPLRHKHSLPLCLQSGSASGRMCAPMTLLATICADMPTMAGCRSYVPLCGNGSVVQQCAGFRPLPG